MLGISVNKSSVPEHLNMASAIGIVCVDYFSFSGIFMHVCHTV